MVKEVKVLEQLESFARGCYFDMSRGDSDTFEKIETKYMRELVIKYGFTLESAKRFVQDCEIEAGLDIRESLREIIPSGTITGRDTDIEGILDTFFEKGNLAQAVKLYGDSLETLENLRFIKISEVELNDDNSKDSETNLLTIKKTKWIYVLPIFTMLIGVPPLLSGTDGAGIGLGFILLGLFFFIRAYRYEGYVTNLRIISRKGAIFRDENEMLFSKVESVGLSNMLVWQNVSVRGTGGSPINLEYIKNGKELKELISERKNNK